MFLDDRVLVELEEKQREIGSSLSQRDPENNSDKIIQLTRTAYSVPSSSSRSSPT